MFQLRLKGLPTRSIFNKLRPILTLGIFDEFNLNQRWIVAQVVERAKSIGAPSIILLLRPRPLEALGLEYKPYCTSVAEVQRDAFSLGVSYVGLLVMNKNLTVCDPKIFLHSLLKRLNFSELWLGTGSTVGRGPSGSPEAVSRIGRDYGFLVNYVSAPNEVENGAFARLFVYGAVEEAYKFRGSPLSITAGLAEIRIVDNLIFGIIVFPERQLLPPPGFYSCTLSGKNGRRDEQCILEIILDQEIFKGHLVGARSLRHLAKTGDLTLTITFVKNLRKSIYKEAVRLTS